MSVFDLSILDEFLLRQIVQKLSFRSCAKFYRSCRGAKQFVDGVNPDWLSLYRRYYILFNGCHRYMNICVLLDAKTFHWKPVSIAMPYEAEYLGAAFLNGEFYVFGGFKRRNRVFLKAAYKLKENLKWEQLPDMNEGRAGISQSSVVYKGCIWVMGGRTDGGLTGTVEAYDPTSNSWITKPPMNRERIRAAAAVANGKLFVCGGFDGRNFIATVEYYDPLLSTWIDCAPLPSERPNLFALVHGSHLMVLGRTGVHQGVQNVWSMDVEEADPQWTSTPMALAMHVDFGMMFGGRLLVGGRPGWRADPVAMEMFGGKTWSSGPELAGLGICKPAIAVSDEFAQKFLEKQEQLALVAQADASLNLGN